MKGSKNKLKVIKDYASQIVEKQGAIASMNNEIASITANIDTLKADLKEKKAAEEAKKAEAESVVRRLFASGMSADEILEKLK
jgi:uncharacterized small protein (DUF1192 family)